MKHSFFHLPTTIIAVVLFASVAFGQGNGHGGGRGGGGDNPPPPPPFDYQLTYYQLPANTTALSFYGIQKINGGIVAVGAYSLDGNRRGFVYDHSSGSFKDFLN